MRLVLPKRATRQQPGSVDSLGSPDISSPEAEPRPSIDRFGWWLVLICAVAFILRLAIVYQGRHDTLSGDGFPYSAQANLNARGHWFVSIFNPAKHARRYPSAGLDASHSRFGPGSANTAGSHNKSSLQASGASP